MIGEVFFKGNSNQEHQHITFEDDDEDDTEEIPYTVLEQYNVRIISGCNSQLLGILSSARAMRRDTTHQLRLPVTISLTLILLLILLLVLMT